MVEGGKAPFDTLPPDVVAARRKAAEETSGGLKPARAAAIRVRRFRCQPIPNGSSAG